MSVFDDMAWLKKFAALIILLQAGPARANGAFPDSLGILLPSDRPNQIIATSNFGLLVSEDAGASWQWICEQAIGLNTFIYQLGPPPDDRLYAVSFDGLSFSADFGCAWDRAPGQMASFNVTDVFPDPVNSRHLLAIARTRSTDAGTPPQGVYESFDGGRTFGSAIYVAPDASTYVSGVEIAASNPSVYFVTLYTLIPTRPSLARSTDRGATWQVRPLAALGPQAVQLLAVDPADAQTVYLRVTDSALREQLAISNDAGATVRVVLGFPNRMTAFLRRSDGALMVAGSDGSVFMSIDRGSSFARLPNAPHLRGLGERTGLLYAVADNFLDGFAVGVSSNGGATWQPLLRFDQLLGPKPCGTLPSICAAPWDALKATLGFGAADGGTSPTRHAGCGCSSHGLAQLWIPAGCLLVALLSLRRRAHKDRRP